MDITVKPVCTKRDLMIMDPRYIKAVVNKRLEPVAFVIGMPDISRGIKQSRGYLLPFGIFQIMIAGRRSKQLNLLLAAIHPAYQNRGLDAILGSAMLASARRGRNGIYRQSSRNGKQYQGKG